MSLLQTYPCFCQILLQYPQTSNGPEEIEKGGCKENIRRYFYLSLHNKGQQGAGAVLRSVEGLSARGEVKGESRPVLGSVQRQGTSGCWTLWRPPSSTSTSSRIRALTSSSTACVPVEAAVIEVLLAGKRGGGGGHLTVLGGGSHTASAILVEHKHGGATLKTRVATLARPVSEH